MNFGFWFFFSYETYNTNIVTKDTSTYPPHNPLEVGATDELATADRPILLADFNLYVLCELWGEFKDLVTSLSTRADPLSYTNLHNHLFIHEFLHKSSLQSIGVVVITHLLPSLVQPPSAPIAQWHSPGLFNSNFNSNRGIRHSRGGWHHNTNQHSSNLGSDCHGLNGSSTSDWREGNWQQNRRHNDT